MVTYYYYTRYRPFIRPHMTSFCYSKSICDVQCVVGLSPWTYLSIFWASVVCESLLMWPYNFSRLLLMSAARLDSFFVVTLEWSLNPLSVSFGPIIFLTIFHSFWGCFPVRPACVVTEYHWLIVPHVWAQCCSDEFLWKRTGIFLL